MPGLRRAEVTRSVAKPIASGNSQIFEVCLPHSSVNRNDYCCYFKIKVLDGISRPIQPPPDLAQRGRSQPAASAPRPPWAGNADLSEQYDVPGHNSHRKIQKNEQPLVVHCSELMEVILDNGVISIQDGEIHVLIDIIGVGAAFVGSRDRRP
jgi:hypothetical protein